MSLTIEPSTVDSQRFYAVRDSVTGTVVAQYTLQTGL